MSTIEENPPATSLRTIRHFIGGAYVDGTSGRMGDVYEPAAGRVRARVEFAGRDDVTRAIASAAAAFPGWARTSPLARARVLMRYRALLEERMAGLVSQLERLPEDPPDFESELTARFERMLHYVETHRAFFTVAAEHGAIGTSTGSSSIPGAKAARSVARLRAMFLSIVEEGIAAGELEPLEPSHLARALGALFRAFSLGALEDGRTKFASDAPTLVRLFLHGASRSATRASKRSR